MRIRCFNVTQQTNNKVNKNLGLSSFSITERIYSKLDGASSPIREPATVAVRHGHLLGHKYVEVTRRSLRAQRIPERNAHNRIESNRT